jgi:hypothetical protein
MEKLEKLEWISGILLRCAVGGGFQMAEKTGNC